MGDDGTDREEMDRQPCRCDHARALHKRALDDPRDRCTGREGSWAPECSCLHFVPKEGVPIPTVGPDHPLMQRRPAW